MRFERPQERLQIQRWLGDCAGGAPQFLQQPVVVGDVLGRQGPVLILVLLLGAWMKLSLLSVVAVLLLSLLTADGNIRRTE